MEVIFIKDLKNQGRKGEIKQVKDGYAENFLIKKGYAVQSTKKTLSKLQEEEKIKEENIAKEVEKATKIKNEIEKLVLKFKVKTGTNDKVFGSITVKQIKSALSEKGYNIDKSMIKMQEGKSTLGFHDIEIELYKNVIAILKIQLIK